MVRRLSYQTGLPIRQIVSEIIIQAENLIEINTPGQESGGSEDLDN